MKHGKKTEDKNRDDKGIGRKTEQNRTCEWEKQ